MNITYSKLFIKQADKLPPKLHDQLYSRIALFLNNPHHPQLRNHQLTGKYAGYHSINITGDLRAIYLVRDNEVVFDQLGTHSQLYG